MPLQAGQTDYIVGSNIRELHKGKTYAHTRAKFGKQRADKQAVAIALSEKRKTIVRARKRKRGSSEYTAADGSITEG